MPVIICLKIEKGREMEGSEEDKGKGGRRKGWAEGEGRENKKWNGDTREMGMGWRRGRGEWEDRRKGKGKKGKVQGKGRREGEWEREEQKKVEEGKQREIRRGKRSGGGEMERGKGRGKGGEEGQGEGGRHETAVCDSDEALCEETIEM